MPVTIEDVARLAEVSTATVSRVLNNHDLVSNEARQRVLDAILKLDYKVNLSARRLRTNQTGTIAVVIPTIADSVINQMIEAIEDAAIEEGYTLLMCSTRGDTEREKGYTRLLTQQRMVDGLLYISPRAAPEEVSKLAQGGLPLVLCNYRLEQTKTPCILFDHVSTAYQTTHYLLSLGHRRIALLNLDAPYYYPARMRQEGFEKAFADFRLRPDPTLIREVHRATHVNFDWRDVIHALLDLEVPPTAIVAFNDEVALQVYAVCRERGLNIPADLSVTGCDDILSSRYVDPPLTTVHIPARDEGRLAMEFLLKQIRHERLSYGATLVLDVELMVRESCAAPSS